MRTHEELAKRSPTALASIVEYDKTRLLRAIEDLKRSARHAISVGPKVGPHAWLWLGAGLALGFILGRKR
jgi:hypothetical protein